MSLGSPLALCLQRGDALGAAALASTDADVSACVACAQRWAAAPDRPSRELAATLMQALVAAAPSAAAQHGAALASVALIQSGCISDNRHMSLLVSLRDFIVRAASAAIPAAPLVSTAAGLFAAQSLTEQQRVFWAAAGAFRRMQALLDAVLRLDQTASSGSAGASAAALPLPGASSPVAQPSGLVLELVAPLLGAIERIAAFLRPLVPDIGMWPMPIAIAMSCH
jgi:hypothetical protein